MKICRRGFWDMAFLDTPSFVSYEVDGALNVFLAHHNGMIRFRYLAISKLNGIYWQKTSAT